MVIEEILSDLSVTTLLTFFCSFLLVYFFIPNIRYIIKKRRLTDVPDERSSHKKATPTMAGVAFFIALVLTLVFIQYFDTENMGINLVAAVSVIFMVALKDDLVLVTPKIKLVVELFAIGLILIFSDLHTLNFQGFLGIFELPLLPSVLIVIIGMIGIINAYNLIDGVDGLASIIAMIIFSNFGLVFFTIEDYFYFLICVSFVGMLGAFLFYNFSKSKKIFMGDTGSLIIGFIIGLCCMRFLSLEGPQLEHFSFLPENSLLFLFSIVSIPIFDTFRVITIRIKNKKSPFDPDRNHLHHLLLDCGLRHHQVALSLGVLNYFIILLVAVLSKNSNYIVMIFFVLFLFGGFIILLDLIKNYLKKKSADKN